MCMSEAGFLTDPPDPPPSCAKHKKPLGRWLYAMWGWKPEHACLRCVADMIDDIARHPDWFGGRQPDPATLQMVIDMLDQKYGL